MREGTDVAIVAIGVTGLARHEGGRTVGPGRHLCRCAQRPVREAVDTELIIKTAKNVRRLVTVEEGCKMGGFGSAALEALSEEGLTHLRTKLIGLPDWYIEQGPQDLLRERYGLTADGIYNSVKALFGASVATDDAARLASLVGSLPHGDEQGS
ncbi:MAG: transketolase C-terminal domain-containing protein [Nitrospira sp.]|nr:hypothetical protein [Nitrospira sp.]